VRPATIAGTDFFRKHVPPSSLPRAADFLDHLTPPDVALNIVRAIRDKQPIIDIPGYLPPLYLFYGIAPRLFRRAMEFGGVAQRDFGNFEWRYEPRSERARASDAWPLANLRHFLGFRSADRDA